MDLTYPERGAGGVASAMIQLHGGIGFTWKHPAHRYLRRAISSRRVLGHEVALERVASVMSLPG